jgi:hypothetical protein
MMMIPATLKFVSLKRVLAVSPVLWSQSREEPKFFAGARISKFRLQLPAPGQLKYLEKI